MKQQQISTEDKLKGRPAILYFIRPYTRRLILLASLAILAGFLETLQVAVLYPILTASLDIESLKLANNPFFVILNKIVALIPVDNLLIDYLILFMLLTIAVFLFRLSYINLSAKTIAKVTTDYKNKVFQKYIDSDYQFFVDNRQGDLLYKAKGAPENIPLVLDGLTTSFIEIVVFISILVLLFTISWKATLGVIALGIIYYYFARILARRVSYVAGQRMKAAGQDENVVLNEYITGTKQIIASGTFQQWQQRFDDAIKTRWRFWAKNRVWVQSPPRVLELSVFFATAIIVMIIWGLYNDIWEAQIPLIGTFAFAGFRMLPRVTSVSTLLMNIMNYLPNLEITYELLEDTTYNKIRNGTREFSGLRSGIELKNVTFLHKNRDADTVSDVSLVVDKNKLTALVGPSGGGKSTVIDLILRLYDIDRGAIMIDGVDIKEYDVTSFRRKVGFVGQETFIYNASVKDNIAFGIECGIEEIIAAAHCANADTFIQKLEHGYDTTIGDRGVKLSGGERQRIAIARSIIRKPDILIMDEATSSLDNISERIVQRAIDAVSQSCTTLVVAHRLSTIRNADIIYVIDDGRIIESGTHDQLIEMEGKYWELYRTHE